MAKKPSITSISSGYQSTTTINSNLTNLRDAFDNTLSLDGSTPNAMQADFDMNSKRIINLPIPISNTEPVRKYEFDNILNDVESIVKSLDLDGTASYTAPGTGAVSRLIYSKLSDTVSVKDFGAVGDGVTDDTAAIQACRAAVGTTGSILIPAGNYLFSGTVYPIGTDFVWTNSNFTGGVNIMTSARANNILVTTETPSTTPMTASDQRVGINVTARANGANHADGIRSNLINYSTDGSGNTAFYGQAVSATTSTLWSAALHGETRHGGGASIGVNTESMSFEASGSLYGAVIANVTTASLTHPITGLNGVDCTNAYGIVLIGTNTSGTGIGGWRYGIFFDTGSMRAGGTTINISPIAEVVTHIQTGSSSRATTADILLQANSSYGIILNGTYTNSAIRLSNNSSIAWEGTGGIKTRYATATQEFEFLSGATQRAALNISGSPKLLFLGTQVVGQRQTGWVAMTGTGNINTTYDVSTVTLSQLAGRVKSLQDALITHGLIGT